MGGVCREILIPHPHAQIRQHQFAHSHELIFPMIQFIHRSFGGIQIIQSPEQIALLLTVPTLLVMLFIRLPVSTMIPTAKLVQLCISSGFHLFDLRFVPVPIGISFMSERIRIDLPIQLIASFFQAFLQFLCPLCCLSRTDACVLRSLFAHLDPPLKSLSSFGNFRVDHFRLGVPVIAIQS
jgi:hypothetical protein